GIAYAGADAGNYDNYQAEEGPPPGYGGECPHGGGEPGQGITLHFGGGPVGGGGQLVTHPIGIFKSLVLPLLPKPRMNVNGKVVFGVVLENAVGFGKQPPVIHHPPPHY